MQATGDHGLSGCRPIAPTRSSRPGGCLTLGTAPGPPIRLRPLRAMTPPPAQQGPRIHLGQRAIRRPPSLGSPEAPATPKIIHTISICVPYAVHTAKMKPFQSLARIAARKEGSGATAGGREAAARGAVGRCPGSGPGRDGSAGAFLPEVSCSVLHRGFRADPPALRRVTSVRSPGRRKPRLSFPADFGYRFEIDLTTAPELSGVRTCRSWTWRNAASPPPTLRRRAAQPASSRLSGDLNGRRHPARRPGPRRHRPRPDRRARPRLRADARAAVAAAPRPTRACSPRCASRGSPWSLPREQGDEGTCGGQALAALIDLERMRAGNRRSTRSAPG